MFLKKQMYIYIEITRYFVYNMSVENKIHLISITIKDFFRFMAFTKNPPSIRFLSLTPHGGGSSPMVKLERKPLVSVYKKHLMHMYEKYVNTYLYIFYVNSLWEGF